MLAANVEAGKQPAVDNTAHHQPPPPPQPEKQPEIQLEEHPAVTGREEEEGETDADAEFDAEVYWSDFEDTDDYDSQGYVASDRKGSNEAIRYRSDTPELPIYRKRSHDVASEEPEIGPTTPPAREGTPPKRARLGETLDEKTVAPILDAPALTQRKRSSEEVEDDTRKSGRQSPKRMKA